MNYEAELISPSRHIGRHISENQYLRPNRPDRHHRLSEPRGAKINLIKINKHKLPNDFFQKKENRRVSEQKNYFPQQFTEPVLHSKKIESQRLIYSPEKTSFFALEEEGRPENTLRMNGPLNFLNRKFETREETKRDLFALEGGYRKVANTSKPAKRNFLELFPPTYDQKMNQIINQSTKNHFLRGTPKKDLAPVQREPYFLIDPEKIEDSNSNSQPNSSRRMKENSLKATILMENESMLPMNITFYNAKSNCLPPINRQNL